VKFQIIYPEGLYLPGKYEFGHYDIEKVIEIRKKQMLMDDDYRELAKYCRERNIVFSASVFDIRGLDLLTELKPAYIKIASCDLNNIRFLRSVAERGIRMIVSTGMSSLGDIEKSVNELFKANFNDLVLLHCVSVYPAKLSEMNLNFLDTLKSAFGVPVGLSDHTPSSIASCVALAKGADYFEKHFTQDKKQEGFDHAYALEEAELVQYVSDIRDTENALTTSFRKIGDNERYVRKRARRSIYAARSIKAGQVISNEDLLVVRPEGILNADEIDMVVGSVAKADIQTHQAISYSALQK
jgi:N,N'-diacetyllegionaminate synthase